MEITLINREKNAVVAVEGWTRCNILHYKFCSTTETRSNIVLSWNLAHKHGNILKCGGRAFDSAFTI